MIRYFTEDSDFHFKSRLATKNWIKSVIASESKSTGDINIIFCSDAYLLDINERFLSHHYYTDIITFDYCEGENISGDLFISIDSVYDNSLHFNTAFDNELSRVIVHGILHLIGYDDHSDEDIKVMRSKEDFYLSRQSEFFHD